MATAATARDLSGKVREVVVAANVEALNTALTENQIQPEKVISVIMEPGTPIAQGQGPTYRVFYRL